MLLTIYNKKGQSKKSSEEYNILVLELKNLKGEELQILDYGNITPVEIDNVEVTIKKNDKGFYVIEEFDYSINFKYNLAINVLLLGDKK